jgi:hypothetical protein
MAEVDSAKVEGVNEDQQNRERLIFVNKLLDQLSSTSADKEGYVGGIEKLLDKLDPQSTVTWFLNHRVVLERLVSLPSTSDKEKGKLTQMLSMDPSRLGERIEAVLEIKSIVKQVKRRETRVLRDMSTRAEKMYSALSVNFNEVDLKKIIASDLPKLEEWVKFLPLNPGMRNALTVSIKNTRESNTAEPCLLLVRLLTTTVISFKESVPSGFSGSVELQKNNFVSPKYLPTSKFASVAELK